MSSQDWQTIKAKLVEMEQTIEALKRLRDGNVVLPESVLRAIDGAIVDSEEKLTQLKNAIVN